MNIENKLAFNEIRTILKGRCISTLGTEWVDKQMQFSSNYEEVIENLNLVNEFSLFSETEEDIYEDNFYDVRKQLLRLRPERTHLEEIELFDLKRSLSTIYSIQKFFTQEDEERIATYPTLKKLAQQTPVFPDIIKRIDEVLNKFGKIKDTASKELLTLRHQIEISSRTLGHSLRSIILQAQQEGYIERDVTPTLRDGRLVIPVSPALKKKIKGIIHDESASGKTVFIEPSTVVDANNKIRELKAAERREIIRILQELSNKIRPHIQDIFQSFAFLARIDYLKAVTSFSNTFNCIVPNLAQKPCIEMHEARHPLLQQTLAKHGAEMQPLDITLKKEQRILLISGPNAGGKSVCLKTVGLLQYMVQCGLPIPVNERSKIGLFQSIYIDLGDEQSIENELSTYSSHLLNMKMMMKNSNSNSLLLIDEFGGGTEPQIGGAIAEGILNRFITTNTWGVITTHYQNLKHFAESQPSVVNGAMLYDRAKMQPLFMLQIGNPGSSFAIEIAKNIGIPEEVINYATNLVGKDYIMSDKYLLDIVRDKMYWERKRQNIRSNEKQLEETIAKYEELLVTVQKQRTAIMAQAKDEALELLKSTNAKIENTIREIKEKQAEREHTRSIRQELADFERSINELENPSDDIDRKMAKIQRRQERKKNGDRNGNTQTSQKVITSVAQPKPEQQALSVGDYVRIKGQNSIGKLEAIQGKNGKVLFGCMNTIIPLNRLEKSLPPKVEKTTAEATFVSKATMDAMREKQLNFKQDIDLRGMRIDEALTAVAYFIDDAIQVGQSRVRILHGTGTGALRQAVRQYLSTINGVESYHDEHIQFGGAGITIVNLY